MAADALIDMRGHVDHVAGAGHERQQPIRFRLGTFRRVGRFPQVNPEVQGAGMILVFRDHLLE